MTGPAGSSTPLPSSPSMASPPEGPRANVGVVVPAAGVGSRMGGAKKAFLELDGVPVLLRSIRPFLDRDDVVAVVIALTIEDAGNPPPWLAGDPRITVVPGGSTRTDSVGAAVGALPASATTVLVHDGARPLVTAGVIDRCLGAVRDDRGAVAGYRAVDTLKRVDGRDRIVDTPDRRALWHAQTPQAFPRAMIEAAYALSRDSGQATDDASLVEAAGFEVVMVESDPWNLKVTHQRDLELASLVLASRPP